MLRRKLLIPPVISNLVAHSAEFSDAHNANEAIAASTADVLGSTMHNLVDAVSKVADKPNHTTIPKPLQHTAGDYTQLSIKQFLAKPIRAASGLLNTTDVVSTYSLINVFGPISSSSMLGNKLDGVFSFRATTVVTFQVNGTRFQQGRYILYHLPTGGILSGDNTEINHKLMHSFTFTQITQLPHIDLDVATDSQVTLRIPYTSWLNATPCINATTTTFTQGSPGFFGLYPYSPLVAGSGSTTASYSLWVHYEDIELYGNMGPQMGDFKGKRSSSSKGDVLASEMSQRGPIEGGLSIVKSVADSLTAVPFLSEMAGTVSWVSDLLGGAAHMFGWSKPIQLSAVQRIKNQEFTGFPNSDVADETTSLSLFADNHVDILPGFASSEVDELSFDYIKDIYAGSGNFTWTTGTAAQATLANIQLSPLLFSRFVVDTTNTLISLTPIAYIAHLFRWWRGGFKFQFKFVKTEFHSGRLMVAYFPSTTLLGGTIATPTFANCDYVQKTILDIRESNEFEIEIPFLSPSSWLSTGYLGASSVTHADVIGSLMIFVLDPLEAPSSVSSSINVLIEVKGASDMEFAYPITVNTVPIVPLAIQMGDFGGRNTTGVVPLEVIGTAKSVPKDCVHAATCIGESVSSMRTLIKRPGFYCSAASASLFNIWPDVSKIIVNVTPAAPSVVGLTRDLYTHCACIYALVRGGVRVKLVSDVLVATNIASSQIFATVRDLGYQTALVPTSTAGSQSQIDHNGLTNADRYDWGASFSIPQYHQNHSFPTAKNLSASISYANKSSTLGSTSKALVIGIPNSAAAPDIYRYGSDDANFGMFCGIPPLYIVPGV